MVDFTIDQDALIATTRANGYALSAEQERIAREVLSSGSRSGGFFDMIVNAIISAVAGVQNFLGMRSDSVSERLTNAMDGGSEVGDLRNVDDRAHTIYRNLVMAGIDTRTAAAMTGNTNGAPIMNGNVRDQFLARANVSPATLERGSAAFVEAPAAPSMPAVNGTGVRYPVADASSVSVPVAPGTPAATRALT